MKNVENLLNQIEANYLSKNKKEKFSLEIKNEIFEVEGLTRSEKLDLMFSLKTSEKGNFGEIYEWMKPVIYKSLKLKDVALKAKENGYIKTYLEVIEMLFEPEDILKIMEFIIEKNNLNPKAVFKEKVEFQKKCVDLSLLAIMVHFSIYWVALGRVITSVISLWLNMRPNKPFLNYSFMEQIMDVLPALISSLVMATIMILISKYTDFNAWATLSIQLCVGTCFYLLCSWGINKQILLFYIKMLIK